MNNCIILKRIRLHICLWLSMWCRKILTFKILIIITLIFFFILLPLLASNSSDPVQDSELFASSILLEPINLNNLNTTQQHFDNRNKINEQSNLDLMVKNKEQNSIHIFEHGNDMEQDDPLILDYIRKHHLIPPSKQKYKLRNYFLNPSVMKHELWNIFKGKRNGIFVEAGACDGEFLSNSLHFERYFNWTGLLVEPNHMLTQRLLRKHRKAWFSNACLSTKPFPHTLNILQFVGDKYTKWQDSFIATAVVDPNSDDSIPPLKGFKPSEYISSGKLSECFPLFSILSAVGYQDIDFFSLDVEGVELKILKTIPFDRINIKVLAIEFPLMSEGPEALVKFMASKGYGPPIRPASGTDFIFIRNASYL